MDLVVEVQIEGLGHRDGRIDCDHPGDNTLDFDLHRVLVRVSGSVRRPDGAAVVGAEVELAEETALTDDAGAYAIEAWVLESQCLGPSDYYRWDRPLTIRVVDYSGFGLQADSYGPLSCGEQVVDFVLEPPPPSALLHVSGTITIDGARPPTTGLYAAYVYLGYGECDMAWPSGRCSEATHLVTFRADQLGRYEQKWEVLEATCSESLFVEVYFYWDYESRYRKGGVTCDPSGPQVIDFVITSAPLL